MADTIQAHLLPLTTSSFRKLPHTFQFFTYIHPLSRQGTTVRKLGVKQGMGVGGGLNQISPQKRIEKRGAVKTEPYCGWSCINWNRSLTPKIVKGMDRRTRGPRGLFN
ncbi:hypothetical protein CDAR_371591 [Caerostris darwini]|uniref:Uncharacterized protein n=1 Tax=Caerostris darwini TaxID=1538125 RepID=A0AAV4X8Q7_9ARAC|nr:hypothetical protein CDAR_371591 [Caerostris darwini]